MISKGRAFRQLKYLKKGSDSEIPLVPPKKHPLNSKITLKIPGVVIGMEYLLDVFMKFDGRNYSNGLDSTMRNTFTRPIC